MLTAVDVLHLIGWAYVGVALLAIVIAVSLARNRRQRVYAALAVMVMFSIWPAISTMRAQQQAVQHAKRLKAAEDRFSERCKGAGETISHTVEGVSGILMMNLRPQKLRSTGQFDLDDPYGRNCSDERDCIGLYLFDYKMVQSASSAGSLTPSTPRLFQFVEVETSTGGRDRYTKESPNAPLQKAPAKGERPRYGVTWKDISTPDDRQHWIAGGSIQVVDMSTGQVIAERRGFLMDPGLGDTSGFRDPWGWARSHGPACPSLSEHNQAFVTKVLQPRKEKN